MFLFLSNICKLEIISQIFRFQDNIKHADSPGHWHLIPFEIDSKGGT